MSFASPGLLWLLLLAPLLVALYFWILRRTRATLYPNLAIVRAAHRAGRAPAPPRPAAADAAGADRAGGGDGAGPAPTSCCRRSSRPSCWPSTPRAACGRPTSSRPASAPRSPRPRRSCRKCRRTSASASWSSAPPRRRSRCRLPSGRTWSTAIDRFILQRGTATGSGLYAAIAMMFPEANIDLEKLVGGSGRETVAPAGRASRSKPIGQDAAEQAAGSRRSCRRARTSRA